MVEYYKISDFAKEVGKHASTVDSWFRKLEERGLHYVNRADEERIYDELDLDIARFVKEKREDNWSIDAIFKKLEEEFELRPFPASGEDEEQIDVEALKEELRREVQEEVRRQRVQDLVLRRQVEAELEEESLRHWGELPEGQRMRKGRFFLKQEDIEKRDEFVRLYVERRFEDKCREMMEDKETV
ncbi:MerR family transcriptional regulator [Alteribacter natronophilus]|uniref:MerR family transcriptional regulator n=1 Tax=Alteribacter natronophilus TaxID=2583810 RepID=UPI00110DE988|nr:MerR family transcriptional regulator [Alteribacter natronophilus]TMW72210.1 MerR family transcriptional regulator [Alteribacter natronophilus]